MRNTILIAIVSLLFLSCKKDEASSKPTLTYKSVNINTLQIGQVIKFTVGFTDTDGDLDSIFIQKITPNCPKSTTIERYQLADDIQKLNSKGDDLLISFGYRVDGYPPIGEPQCATINDTCYFRFAVLDKGKNKSDTVRSENIVIINE